METQEKQGGNVIAIATMFALYLVNKYSCHYFLLK